MSDDHDWVRRLLAEETESPEPMPPHVADRLDRVLEEAVDAGGRAAAEPAAPPPATTTSTGPGVVAMTPRRHRQWAAAVLAAAALTVGGYSLTATGMWEGGGAESAATADAPAGGALEEPEAPEATGSGGSRSGADSGSSEGAPLERDLDDPVVAELSSATLRRDAARLVAGGALRRSLKGPMTSSRDTREPPSSAVQPTGCVPPSNGVPGRRVVVTFDGQRATAVVRRTDDGRSDVQLWDCGSPTRLARVVVPR